MGGAFPEKLNEILPGLEGEATGGDMGGGEEGSAVRSC